MLNFNEQLNIEVKNTIREISNFPKKGISFKDITPILKNPELCKKIVSELCQQISDLNIDAVAAVESRGFLFGLMLANALNKPFIPIRKKGKLPYETIEQTYSLEYGTATIEMHKDAFATGDKILIHDDLLATGGTVLASAHLIKKLGGEIAGFSFIVSLGFLNAHEKLNSLSTHIYSIANYE